MIPYISKLLTSIDYLLKSSFQGFWSTIPFAKLQLFLNFSRKHPLSKARYTCKHTAVARRNAVIHYFTLWPLPTFTADTLFLFNERVNFISIQFLALNSLKFLHLRPEREYLNVRRKMPHWATISGHAAVRTKRTNKAMATKV